MVLLDLWDLVGHIWPGVQLEVLVEDISHGVIHCELVGIQISVELECQVFIGECRQKVSLLEWNKLDVRDELQGLEEIV